MIPFLGPYAYLAAGLALVAALGGAYLKGRGDGRDAAEVRCQAQQIAAQRAREQERADLQAALDARAAELARRQQEGADAVEKVRVEYLPAKVVVKREVAKRVVYRDCRIGDGMRDTLNAALRGAPTADATFDPGAGVVPARAGPAR